MAKATNLFLIFFFVVVAIFLFGCTSSDACGNGVCSSSEANSCSCEVDCGLCTSPGIVEQKVENILTVPISSISNEIDLFPLISSIDLSQVSVPAISVSGSIELPNKTDYFRVILVDGNNKEHLVFEAYYPLMTLGANSFDGVCNETCDLGKINPKSLRFETNLTDFSKIKINSLSITSGRKESQKQFAAQRMNSNLSANNETWVAGDTSVSRLSYSEKKSRFGDGTASPPNGFDYYAEGVYGTASSSGNSSASAATPSAASSTTLPNSWDWRNRGGKNYISTVKDQGNLGLCWAFASVAAVEAGFNLYYNSILNYDLAEKEYYCGSFNDFYQNSNTYGSGSSILAGGYAYQGLGFIKKYGVVDESCLPFSLGSNSNLLDSSCSLAASVNCSGFTFYSGRCAIVDSDCAFCKNKNFATGVSACTGKTVYSISDFTRVGSDNYSVVTDLTVLKKALIEKGPLTVASSLYNTLDSDADIKSHAMLLVGYEIDSQARTILIFKNSWGTDWGARGYVKTYVPSMNGVYYVTAPIIKSNGVNPQINCVDEDNDTYCNWGISTTKPSSCPSTCSSLKDCDDSNPGLHEFDSGYNCVNVGSGTVGITSTPVDSNIYFGQVYKGKTPMNVEINAGTYNILVKKEGYLPFISTNSIDWKQTLSLNALLVRDTKNVWSKTDALSETEGASTYYDGMQLLSRILIDNIFSDASKLIFQFKGLNLGNGTAATYKIDAAFICERDTGAICVVGTEKRITFNNADGVDVPNNSFVNSDQIEYTLSKQKTYLVTLFTNNGLAMWVDKHGIKKTNFDEYKSIMYLSNHSTPVSLSTSDYIWGNIGSGSKVIAVYGLEKIIGVNNNSVCGDSVCSDDETYSSCVYDCPSTKQCSNSEPCCENNSFKPQGAICELGQNEISCRGNNLMQRTYDKICSGTSGTCVQGQYSAFALNTACSQTCLSDTNTCSNYACWPFGKDENRSTGINAVGACKVGLDSRKCVSGSWSDWNVVTSPILPSVEVCDLDMVDESCDGNVNEGCACVNGAQTSCSLTSECGVGEQVCANGQWKDCELVSNKVVNSVCSTGVCAASGLCVTPVCSQDSNCFPSGSCKIAKCASAGDWNAVCVETNKAVNASCEGSKVCSSVGTCVSASCSSNSDCGVNAWAGNAYCNSNNIWDSSRTFVCASPGTVQSVCVVSDENKLKTSCASGQVCNNGLCVTPACSQNSDCVSANPCKVGTCASPGAYNSTCSYADKPDTSVCASSSQCLSGVCKPVGKIIYSSSTFNSSPSGLLIKVNNSDYSESVFFEQKTVSILFNGSKVTEFVQDFSTGDLNLLSVGIDKGTIADTNKNYVILKNLQIQTTKTIYLPKKTLASNGICVLNEETDLNGLKQSCTKMPCPGNENGVACSVDGNTFVVSGLTHSGVMEDFDACYGVSCSVVSCDSQKHLVGSCWPTCSGGVCGSCTPTCTCASGWLDSDSNMLNGCETQQPVSVGNGANGVVCSSNASCGVSDYIGNKFCVNNFVYQTYRQKTCQSPGTTSSSCLTTDSNKLISSCASNETCSSGVCVLSTPAVSCVSNSDCLPSEFCLNKKCSALDCATNYSPIEHKCGCDGTSCFGECYITSGVCCNNQWIADKASCFDKNNEVVLDNNDWINEFVIDTNKENSSPGFNLGTGILVCGVLFVLILIILIIFKKKGQ